MKKVVIKVSKENNTTILKEIMIQLYLYEKELNGVEDCYFSKMNDYFNLGSQFHIIYDSNGTTLEKIISHSLTEKQIIKILINISKGAELLHKNGIINLGINPYGIRCLNNSKNENHSVYISDFENASFSSNMEQSLSLDNYSSPEELNRKHVTGKSDVWSLGCLIFFLLQKDHLITASQPKDILLIISKIFELRESDISLLLDESSLIFTDLDKVSLVAQEKKSRIKELSVSHPKLHSVMVKALEPDPINRISMKELLNQLLVIFD